MVAERIAGLHGGEVLQTLAQGSCADLPAENTGLGGWDGLTRGGFGAFPGHIAGTYIITTDS